MLKTISSFCPDKISKKIKRSEASSVSEDSKKCSKTKPRIKTTNSKAQPSKFMKKKFLIKNMFQHFSNKQKISCKTKNNNKELPFGESRVHYKNDYKHLISICESIQEKKLNEISGNELVQYLSVPGISRIQKYMKQIKLELIKSRRMKNHYEGNAEDH